jgi:membrane protease YdiL (CAAX protease family)
MTEDRVAYRRLILDLFIVKRKNVTELQFKQQQLAGLEFKEGELYRCIVRRQVLPAECRHGWTSTMHPLRWMQIGDADERIIPDSATRIASMSSSAAPREGHGTGAPRANAVLLGLLPVAVIFVLDGFFKEALHGYSPALFWAFDVLKFVVIPAAILVWLARRFSIVPSDYGMRRMSRNEGWPRFLGLTVFLVVLLSLVFRATLWIALMIVPPAGSGAFYGSMVPEGWLHFPVVLYFAVTAGFVEEIFFRALPLVYLGERFAGKIPVAAYLIGSSVLFASIHWENGAHEVAATFMYGLLAGTLYLKLRDLWPLIGAHVLIDVWSFS